jgi:hypothetical protein
MRRLLVLLGALAALSLGAAGPAAAAEWHAEQPVAEGIGIPVPLGSVGDIEFWAPNRGLLITGGNDGVEPGLFAYDGTGWYRYSTVCGGAEGRIAWAGPDDFWTISDQQIGQGLGSPALGAHRSLCHFVDGEVVASYAEPIGVPTSYEPLNAAACSGPANCWFGGERLPGTVNTGAFHLHWNGSSLTPVPSLTEPQPSLHDPNRAVGSLEFHRGTLYESVQVAEDDHEVREPELQPFFLHRITTAANPFVVEPAPVEYGTGAKPWQLEAFRLSSDGNQLWAVAGATSAPATVTALHKTSGAFSQVHFSGAPFEPGDRVRGLAAEPGSETAWISYVDLSAGDFGATVAPARLVRVAASGIAEPAIELPAAAEGLARKGFAGPIACPGAGQCWMATSLGWLFHLGPDLPQDTDPAMHRLITFRPPDNGLPAQSPDSLPADDSGAEAASKGQPALEIIQPSVRHPRSHPLLTGLHQKVLDRTLLELTFTLHARAHVQLLAKRAGRIVARTQRVVMAKGKRSVRLRLDPKAWPTKLDFEVHPINGGKK